MLEITDAKIGAISLHRVGNKSRNEEALYASDLFELDKDLTSALLKFFLSPFISKREFYDFSHHENKKFSEVRQYVKTIFSKPNSFLEESIKIARHLYSIGMHPNIHSGELFICEVHGAAVDGKLVGCVGIFKSETKDHYLNYIQNPDSSLVAKLEQGASLNGLDKGALVILEKGSTEPRILVLDKRNADAQYWVKSFLNAELGRGDAFKTGLIIESCISFSKSEAVKSVDKKDIISANNYVVDYFSNTPQFDADDFFDGFVLDEYRETFKSYVSNNAEQQGLDITERFDVVAEAVKKVSSKIKNIIKLDTSIELKINRDQTDNTINLEKGYDEDKGMYYYKVYFNQEIL